MKISLNWLRDYIQIDLTIDKLSELLTDIGLEVESVDNVESVKGGLKDLVIGEVISCEQHENADRLQVCIVNVGTANHLQIVCGAKNIGAGQKVVVAPVGSTIHPIKGEAFQIGEAKLRGVASFGMICAEDEIGLGDDHDGIMVLKENAPIGELASNYFEIESDTVFEIGLTPNRSDANSHLGTARDLAAAIAVQYNKEVKVNWPNISEFAVKDDSAKIEVIVEAKHACPRYAGVAIKNITLKPSPKWLQNRLKSIGVKAINNIVDITNFINHEYGQPLHAFDYDKIEGKKITVKHLENGTKFTTLDGIERSISNEDLMICDESGGIALAGVYGGLHSGVKDSTTNIFLESAYFDAQTIRRTELRHNLRTEAAMKYEKGIDPTKQVEVLKRAALLVKELAGGEISSSIIDVQAEEVKPKEVTLNYKRLNQLTGIQFEKEITHKILEHLDFEILDESVEDITVKVPLYRSDVYREADVIEEVLRIYGFNNVPLTGKANYVLNYETNQIDELRNALADQLSANGLNEIMTNSITRSSYYKKIESMKEENFVRPINSLNAHLDIMRPDMLMTGLESIAHNLNRNLGSCLFFDFGKTYAKYGDKLNESSRLAIYLSGNMQSNSWLTKNSEASFYDLKQIVDGLLLKAGITTWKSKETKHPFLQEGLQYTSSLGKVANFGIVKKEIASILDVNAPVLFADLDFDIMLSAFEQKQVRYEKLSKFPAIERDLALVIDQSVTYNQIDEIARQKGGKYLVETNLFDVFESKEKLGADKKSYAVSFRFENTEQTLTNKQIDKQMKQLIQSFEQQLNALIRS